VRRVREAVLLGLNVLDVDYEKLDVDVANSDSDDDVATPAVSKTPVMFERKVCLIIIVIRNIKMPPIDALNLCRVFLHVALFIHCRSKNRPIPLTEPVYSIY